MKNQSSSHLLSSYVYPFNSRSSNSRSSRSSDYLLEVVDDDSASALTQGLYHQIEDWVALELTAEQMLGREVNIVTTYVASDVHQMWETIKETLLPYELAAGQLLLGAADPTQVEWSRNSWWSR